MWKWVHLHFFRFRAEQLYHMLYHMCSLYHMLSIQHAETAFVDSSCFHCRNMSIAVLRSRLSYHGPQVPSPMPRSAVFFGRRQEGGTSMCWQGDLRIMVRAFLPRPSPWAPNTSSTLQPVVLPEDHAGLGAPAEDQISIVASEGE